MSAKNHAERILMSAGSNARLYVVDHMEMWARFYENFQFYERFMAITPDFVSNSYAGCVKYIHRSSPPC